MNFSKVLIFCSIFFQSLNILAFNEAATHRLFEAIEHYDAEAVLEAIADEADYLAVDEEGYMPLHRAVLSRDAALVEAVLSVPLAYLFSPDAHGRTAFALAALGACQRTQKLLIRYIAQLLPLRGRLGLRREHLGLDLASLLSPIIHSQAFSRMDRERLLRSFYELIEPQQNQGWLAIVSSAAISFFSQNSLVTVTDEERVEIRRMLSEFAWELLIHALRTRDLGLIRLLDTPIMRESWNLNPVFEAVIEGRDNLATRLPVGNTVLRDHGVLRNHPLYQMWDGIEDAAHHLSRSGFKELITHVANMPWYANFLAAVVSYDRRVLSSGDFWERRVIRDVNVFIRLLTICRRVALSDFVWEHVYRHLVPLYHPHRIPHYSESQRQFLDGVLNMLGGSNLLNRLVTNSLSGFMPHNPEMLENYIAHFEYDYCVEALPSEHENVSMVLPLPRKTWSYLGDSKKTFIFHQMLLHKLFDGALAYFRTHLEKLSENDLELMMIFAFNGEAEESLEFIVALIQVEPQRLIPHMGQNLPFYYLTDIADSRVLDTIFDAIVFSGQFEVFTTVSKSHTDKILRIGGQLRINDHYLEAFERARCLNEDVRRREAYHDLWIINPTSRSVSSSSASSSSSSSSSSSGESSEQTRSKEAEKEEEDSSESQEAEPESALDPAELYTHYIQWLPRELVEQFLDELLLPPSVLSNLR